ncbi:MAG: hypothetical protein NT086_07890 [Proteobacteria bacterium]|nr:hypothetical protein [Pseudomonadota bacterium]
MQDKTIIYCSYCDQKMRVPFNAGHINLPCPSCKRTKQYKLLGVRTYENDKYVVDCISCDQKLRVPLNSKTLQLTCPTCKIKWETSINNLGIISSTNIKGVQKNSTIKNQTNSRPSSMSNETQLIANHLAELNAIKEECYSLVTKRAAISATASAVPMPGTDIAADIAIMLELIPAINQKFGLAKEQIEGYSPTNKILIYKAIESAGSQMAGQLITKTIITQILKNVAGKAAVKQVLKFVPIVGSLVNAGIGFTAMKHVGNSHVDDCFEVRKNLLAKNIYK